MKYLDLLRMSSSNLFRRKLRTVLTVLGVLIGTASIVVMVSLGLGLKKSTMEQIEQYGGLTTIEVYSNERWGGNSEDTEVKRINDEVVGEIGRIPYVEYVSPSLSFSLMAKKGNYEGYIQLKGMTTEALQNMEVKTKEGTLPLDEEKLEFYYGNQVITNFYDSKGNQGYWETGELPNVDPMNDAIFYIFDTDTYWQSQNNSGDGQVVTAPKKYMVPTCGIMEGDVNQYQDNCYNVLVNMEPLKRELKKIFKNKVIPGQPTTKSGKPYKELFYNEMQVKVDTMDHVQEVQTTIQNMGFETYSNAEWMEQTQEQMQMIQLVLGGIGAVSLFVAAIGIANTMMMSIYERTKEIGVMKVLGCDLRNIRTMFLMEAGFIGFIGGAVGLVLSYIISAVINLLAGEYYEGISYIPLWLAALSLVFAVLVGMAAGFFPALRAMRLSPLAAIRNE